jgi:hypothetical protein
MSAALADMASVIGVLLQGAIMAGAGAGIAAVALLSLVAAFEAFFNTDEGG